MVELEQDDSATHHLRLLAADAPTEQDAAGIRAFVDKVDARRPYRFNAYIAAAPSSNVNNGSNHSTVYSPIFGSNLTIGEDSRKTSGIGGAVGANAAFNRRIGNDFSFVAAANGEVRVYDESDFNYIALSQSSELRYMFDRGYFGFGGVASQSVDDDSLDMSYLSYGPRVSGRLNLTARDTLTASSTYEWRNYTASTSSDGTAWMTDIAWTHAFNAATNVTLSGGYDDVNLELKQASYNSWSGGLALYKELPLGITTSLTSEIKFSEFDDVNLLAGVIREDTRYVAGICLTKRDLIAPVNLFSKVGVDAQGRFAFVPDHSKAGDFVELRFDMDVILAMSTAPHGLDTAPSYSPKKVGLLAWRCGAAPAVDVCRAFRPENARALHNTDMLYL